MNDLASRDEVQFGKRQDAGLVERRLEREVVAGECFDGVQPAHPQSGADASFLAERKFFEEKLLDHFERGNFAAVETGYAGIDHFDGARHFEANHADFDAIKQRCRRIGKQRVHAPALLFETYGQHQPLNRQAERFARKGVPLSTSTFADQVGAAAFALMPLYRLIETHVLTGERLHGDDTTVPVMAR